MAFKDCSVHKWPRVKVACIFRVGRPKSPKGITKQHVTARGMSEISNLSGEHRWPSLAGNFERHSLKLCLLRYALLPFSLWTLGHLIACCRKDRWCKEPLSSCWTYRRVSHELFAPERENAAGILQIAYFGVVLNFILLCLGFRGKTQWKKQDDIFSDKKSMC